MRGMDTIRWGIIGCGDVCEVKSGPGFQKAEGSRLVAVMRRDAAKAEDFARRHGVPRWYADARALIADSEVDAVYIATPPSSHFPYTKMVAAAGKAVYVEKPMATTAAECEEMIAACAAAKVPLFVAYYRRRLPRFVRVKELVDAGAIGEVRAVQVTLTQPPEAFPTDPAALPWRVVPEIAGGGLFLDLASHTIDLLDELCGPIESAHGHAVNQAKLYPAEDAVVGSFRFASGVVGTGLWSFVADTRRDTVEILGTRGRICFATFDEEPIVIEDGSGRNEIRVPHPPHVQQPLIQSVVDELCGRGVCPSTGRSGLRTAKVLDSLLADFRAR